MPLKLIPPRPDRKSWTVRGTYLGKYVNRSTKAGKRAIAAKVLKGIERSIERGEFAEPGEPTFASAARDYMKAGGERTYVGRLLHHFGDKPLSHIDQVAIDAAALALYPQAANATRNRSVYTPVSAILRRGGVNLNLRRPSGAGGNKATSWLWPEQAEAIFKEAKKLDARFAALLIVLCYTGMRLSEALNLTWNDVRLADGYAYLPTTKSDDPRAVYLPPVAVAALGNLQGGPGDRVFGLRKSGHIYSLLRAAASRSSVSLPERSAFHIFRHTYATWMRRYGGLDEIGLLALGAWRDQKSVARYTHTVVSEEAKRAALLPVGAKTVRKAHAR